MLIKIVISWKSEFLGCEQKVWARRAIDIARTANPDLYRSIKWKGNLTFIFNPIIGDNEVKDLISMIFNFPDEEVMRKENFPYTVKFETLSDKELEEYWSN